MRKTIFLFLLFLTGCGFSQNVRPSFQATHVLIENKETEEPEKELMATSALPSPTPYQTPTPSWPDIISTPSIPLSAMDVQIRCLGQENLLSFGLFDGSIAYIKRETRAIHLLNLQNGKDIPDIGETDPVYTAISPDQTKLAFKLLQNKQINIITSNGNPEKVFYVKQDLYLSHWLNNQELLFELALPNDPYPTDVVVINPYKNSNKKIEYKDYPERYTKFPGPRRFAEMYNADQTRVLYPASYESKWMYGLWDLQNKKLITMLSDVDKAETYSKYNVDKRELKSPQWYKDGTKFALPLSGWMTSEMYVVTKDGEQKQITHLLPYFPDFYIERYFWSPDGKYLALVGKNVFDSEVESQLIIVDTTTGLSTFTCMQVVAGDLDPNNAYPSPIYWSPDGEQAAYENIFSDKTAQTYIIDLKDWELYKVGENMQIIGWLKE